ncbi:hypothetical protein S101258_01433 [Lactiplantibacillus plantarum subsp. plantarum]|uniref:Uncharacterized protein n=1 Tax=Lactiplantibacillus plantarum subsp. plantarum TaxID=337330 RepID=A0A2S3U761_LACPN|nr:hypothetical protein A8704_03230 [Lactiplantibacillus plantarum]POD85225.1 hypothetical protein S101258_01433 [Lactiplantibacillus plantarum subsp. plantarum]
MSDKEFNEKFANSASIAEKFMMDSKSIQRVKSELKVAIAKNEYSDDETNAVFMSLMAKNYVDKLVYTLLKDLLVD